MSKEKAERSEQLDEIIVLLQQVVAIQFARAGMKQAEIGKRMGVAAGTVNKLIKGVTPDN